MYEVPSFSLLTRVSEGVEFDVTSLLSNGRANYIFFQEMVARCTGWTRGSEGAGAPDLWTPDGLRAEVKAYKDPVSHSKAIKSNTDVHTAASSTFGPNNKGPEIRRLLKAGDYSGALAICRDTGYDKNDFYVYTNTAAYKAGTAFRYLIVSSAQVLENLSSKDPRIIDRGAILGLAESVEQVAI